MNKLIPDSEKMTCDFDDIHNPDEVVLSTGMNLSEARRALGPDFNAFTAINFRLEQSELYHYIDASLRDFSGDSEKYRNLKNIYIQEFYSNKNRSVSDENYRSMLRILIASSVLTQGELIVTFENIRNSNVVLYNLYKKFEDQLQDLEYVVLFFKKYEKEYLGDRSLEREINNG